MLQENRVVCVLDVLTEGFTDGKMSLDVEEWSVRNAGFLHHHPPPLVEDRVTTANSCLRALEHADTH